MKIRTAFVSNSSSSSFCIVTTLANHNKALEQLSPYYRAAVEVNVTKSSFAGMDVVSIGQMSVMDEPTIEYESPRDVEPAEGEYDSPFEAIGAWERLIKENPSEVFAWSADG